jgi:hypothetical protein
LRIRPRHQPVFQTRAFDRLEEEPPDGAALRRVAGFVGNVRATGCSAAKLLFNTSIKLMTFWADGAAATVVLGTSARFSVRFEIKTVRKRSSSSASEAALGVDVSSFVGELDLVDDRVDFGGDPIEGALERV